MNGSCNKCTWADLNFILHSIACSDSERKPQMERIKCYFWYRLIERSQPTKSFNLYENIFRHFCPCQFKVQITTGINHNKGSLLKQLSIFCFVVVGILRYSRLFSQPISKKLRQTSNLLKQHNEVEFLMLFLSWRLLPNLYQSH